MRIEEGQQAESRKWAKANTTALITNDISSPLFWWWCQREWCTNQVNDNHSISRNALSDFLCIYLKLVLHL